MSAAKGLDHAVLYTNNLVRTCKGIIEPKTVLDSGCLFFLKKTQTNPLQGKYVESIFVNVVNVKPCPFFFGLI